MPRLIRASIILAAIMYGISLHARAKKASEVELTLVGSVESAPRFSVLLHNHSKTSVFVRGDITDVSYDAHNPLQAHVFDVHSGKRVFNRYEIKRAYRPMKESDFMELKPAYWYGLTVDLRDRFILKEGGRYRVHFTYTSASPSKVGRISPWAGPAISDSVTFTMPKSTNL